MRALLLLGIILSVALPRSAQAGFIEVSGSGSFRKSHIDTNAYDEASTATISGSYYFNEASALELSYTDGRSKRAIAESSPNGQIQKVYYQTLGLDFVYTIGERGAMIRPYLKAGAQYILAKRLIQQFRDPSGNWYEPDAKEDPPALVPSAGAGVKLTLTESLSLKAGVDAWTSRPINKEPLSIDLIARVGLSWLF